MSAGSDEDALMQQAIEQSLALAGIEKSPSPRNTPYQIPTIPPMVPTGERVNLGADFRPIQYEPWQPIPPPGPGTYVRPNTMPVLPTPGGMIAPYIPNSPYVPNPTPSPRVPPPLPQPQPIGGPYIPPAPYVPKPSPYAPFVPPQIPVVPIPTPGGNQYRPTQAPYQIPQIPQLPSPAGSPTGSLSPLPAWQSPNPHVAGPASPPMGGPNEIDMALAELADAQDNYEQALKRLSEASARYNELLAKEEELKANQNLIQQQNMEYEMALQQDQAMKQGYVSPVLTPRSTPSGKQSMSPMRSPSTSPLSSPPPVLSPPMSEEDSYMVKIIYPDRSVETIATTGNQTVGGIQRYASKKFKKPINVHKSPGQFFTLETTLRELGGKNGMVFRFTLP